MIDRRLLKNFDWSIPFVAILISLLGVATIYSATRPVFDLHQQTFYLRQLYWIGLGVIVFLVVISIDYRYLIRFAYILFLIGLVLLVIVLFVGRKGMGAQRWIPLGPFSFQPSEFFKIFFVITLSRYLSETELSKPLGLQRLIRMFALFVFTPFMLIVKQPDLGTAIILLLLFSGMVMIAGVRRKIAVMAIIIGLISMPFIGNIMWENLRDYQRQRLVAFIEPEADPRGVGYHITQSKITIGSGGFKGKGYQKGTQGPLRFLPERHTDFIFSIFAEEWGFVGSVVLFSLYLFLIIKGLDTVRKARDLSGSFIVFGVSLAFSSYFIINVGMTLGMVPVVGIPMPLFSYGGTAMLSNFLALGIIENVRMRRSFVYY
jgi:rod shape determining protein RodA